MATIASTKVTYKDIVSAQLPDGTVANVIEILSEMNPIINDAIVLESNMDSAHRSVIRTGLPEPTWRKFNYGVTQAKGTTQQVDDAMGMLEVYSIIDKDLAELGGNLAQNRFIEASAHLEGMAQKMAETLFYGNGQLEKEAFTGLTPRFNSLSTNNQLAGYNIIDAGGTQSDNASIWIVTWDPTVAHMIYPKGKKGGLQHLNDGVVDIQDGNGNSYKAYRDHFKWDMGFVLKDWRNICRIANIDVSNLASAGASGYSGPDIINLLIKGLNKIKFLNKGKIVIYCNRAVHTALDLLAANRSNVHLTSSEVGGVPILKFRGYPIQICDALTEAEDRVV
jgi:hypothetical protein